MEDSTLQSVETPSVPAYPETPQYSNMRNMRPIMHPALTVHMSVF